MWIDFAAHSELPPRARRIQTVITKHVGAKGTTSACAENTKQSTWSRRCAWNYLRVRGEYHQTWEFDLKSWELPPRARRILGDPTMTSFGRGTTSACAENTLNELGLL